MTKATTVDLIAKYDAAITGRWINCQLGSTRAASRQRKIDAIVDELARRDDNGDAEAAAWLDAT